MLYPVKESLHSFIKQYKLFFCLLLWVLLHGYPGRAQPVELTIPFGHPNTVMDFSADGKLLVTGSFDNSFIIWDVRTCYMIRHVFVGNQVQQILLLPNNEDVITVSGNESIKYVLQKWDVLTGQLKSEMPFTASPGIQVLPGTTYLVVPDFSTQKAGNTGGILESFELMSKSEAFEDSIEQVFDDIMEELAQRGEIEPDTDDPQKQKAVQEKAVEVKMELLSGKQRNISIVNASTFELIARHRYTAQKIKAFIYNGTNYLVTVKDIPNTFEKDVVIGLWEVNELLEQYGQKKKIKPQKEWHVKTTIDELIIAPGTGYFATCNDRNAVQLWQVKNEAPMAMFTAKGETVNGMSFSSRGDELYVCSGNSPEAFVENWNTTSFKKASTMALPPWYMPGDIRFSPYDKYFLLPGNNGLVKFSLKGDSISRFSGRAGIASRFGFANNDEEVIVKYNELPDFRSPEMMAFFMKLIEDDARRQGKSLTKEEKERLLNLKMGVLNTFNSSPLFKSFIYKWVSSAFKKMMRSWNLHCSLVIDL